MAKAIREHEAVPLPSKSFFSSLTSSIQYSEETAAGVSIHKAISESEGDTALLPLTDYLDRNLKTLCDSLSPQMAQEVIKRIWEESLLVIEAILIPPLYGQIERERRYLNRRQISMAEFTVQDLRAFFHGDGGELGLPLRVLDTKKYSDVRSLLACYHDSVDRLKREYEMSLLSGREKEFLLRIVRLRFEKEDGLSATVKDEGKIWVEQQLTKRAEQSRR